MQDREASGTFWQSIEDYSQLLLLRGSFFCFVEDRNWL
jgi:hypothetical protein